MKTHFFQTKTYEGKDEGKDVPGYPVTRQLREEGERGGGGAVSGMPVLAQVKGARKGSFAAVCAKCGGTAAEDGTTPDHPVPPVGQ